VQKPKAEIDFKSRLWGSRRIALWVFPWNRLSPKKNIERELRDGHGFRYFDSVGGALTGGLIVTLDFQKPRGDAFLAGRAIVNGNVFSARTVSRHRYGATEEPQDLRSARVDRWSLEKLLLTE
jgi:hypothetical protein